MRLIITGGGTGGHLFPGIAVAAGLQKRVPATRILFIGTSRLLDQQALVGQGFELAALDCGGVKGLGFTARLRSVLLMPGAVVAALRLLRRFKPDLVFGVGGYVTGHIHTAEEPWFTTQEPVPPRSRCINEGAGYPRPPPNERAGVTRRSRPVGRQGISVGEAVRKIFRQADQ